MEDQISPYLPSPAKTRAKKYVYVYLAVILFLVSFGLGAITDRVWYVKKQISNSNGNIEISKVLNLNRSLNKSKSVDFEQFWEVWDKIKEDYVNGDVKDADLFYGALQGMVMALDDPYSLYFPPQMAAEFAKDLSGEMEGIGSEIGIKNKQLMVIAPLPDSPAEKAGLRPGDRIIAVNGSSTLGIDVSTAVMIIRGKAGTTVKLLIGRDGWEKAKEFSIVRAKINIPSVTYSMKDGKIAYIRIMQFNENTGKDFDKYVLQMRKDGAKGLVVDLRNNPGGYLSAAVDAASQWIEKGQVIVSQKDKNGSGVDSKSKGPAVLSGFKTVVLVNKGSASASEILAGALQDGKLGVVMGEATFGKGSVQDFEPFSDGSALKLTVAEWFTPSGKNINKEGIKPNLEVKENWDDEKVGQDDMLDAALKLFSSSTFKWN